MKMNFPGKYACLLFGLWSISQQHSVAQRYLTDIDSSFLIKVKDTVMPVIKRFQYLYFSGYIQPQYQKAQAEGVASYAGGNFSQFSSSRFMLRRSRIRLDYILPSRKKYPLALFTFQLDATERGVFVRDMFTRIFETNHNNFAVTAGLFARPFGFEVNLSSAFRESPERGRMSQILMPSERDVGVMLSFDPHESPKTLKHFRVDAGFFNGQGLSGMTDFDNFKDVISRLSFRNFKLNSLEINGGLSILRGGWKNGTRYVYKMGSNTAGDKLFTVDSSLSNIGKSSPRHYYGADIQLSLRHAWGETELRAEHWFGTQPGTENSTANPGALPNINGMPLPTYIRRFNGSFFYFLQNIVNAKHQLILKYDWYDPNIKVKKTELGKPGTNLTAADIKYSTWGLGYIYRFHSNLKLIFYYDMVQNEPTAIPEYLADKPDNIFTCRLQFRF